VEIKPETHFRDWIEHELLKRYNYICCDDIRRFYHEKRAITKEGLIRMGTSLHEKDDRRRIDDRRNYVLGWSNKEKIKAMEQELEKLNCKKGIVGKEIKIVETEIQRRHQMEWDIRDFIQFKDYSD